MSSREWDAASYHRVSEPQLAWAREQLERLELSGEETLLDAGCGSGRVTAELLANAVGRPRGHGAAIAQQRQIGYRPGPHDPNGDPATRGRNRP